MTRVVLVSGGLDSAVALKMAARDEHTISLVVDYGQKNRTELVFAEWLVKMYGSNRGVFVECTLPLGGGLASGSIDTGRSAEQIGVPGDEPKAYTPGRNTLLLSLALNVVEREASIRPQIECREIWIGANADDYHGYPDCRREYFDAFEAMCAAMGKSIRVVTPFIDMTKSMVVSIGRGLGVDFKKTSSCYLGTDCRKCDACVLRAKALGEI
jgi:7-cyano-7-deazaguanine synthase